MAAVTVAVRLQLYNIANSPNTFPELQRMIYSHDHISVVVISIPLKGLK